MKLAADQVLVFDWIAGSCQLTLLCIDCDCSTMYDEKAKKTGEIIFSVTQNLTCELPQFLRDFGDYECKLEILHHSLTVRNFVECTINKKSHDLLAQFVINRYS